ncbi:MAG: methionyl-tRNA formyltransferase [Acidobacteriota bacterium]
MQPLVFFGTPHFAVPTLLALCDAGRSPSLVVSQPSRPQGRRRRVIEPPVVVQAKRQGLPTVQPASVTDPAFMDRLRDLEPAVAIVVAFGQIFKADLLGLPRSGCINLHASLLPRFRGASPVQAAIMAGETISGVTTMVMDEGLDTGDILLQKEVEIGSEETAPELGERLATLGADLVVETLNRLEDGAVQPKPQDDDEATFAPRLTRDDGRIVWSREAKRVFDHIRGLLPWPGSWSLLRGEPVKVLWGLPVATASSGHRDPGTVVGLEQGKLIVSCGEGTFLGVERLQRAGRRALDAEAFVNGERLEPGESFR